MKYINKIATVFLSAMIGMLVLTGCEGSEIYGVDSPDWLSAKIDSIKNANSGGGEDIIIEGLQEDVYDIGKEDLTSGFWTLGKTYVVPAGQKWQAQFNLTVNPDNVYYKNCYVVLNAYNDALGDSYYISPNEELVVGVYFATSGSITIPFEIAKVYD